MADYIDREAAIEKTEVFCDTFVTKWTDEKVLAWIRKLPVADVVPVVPGHSIGDFCIYAFDNKNKSLAIVEIVRILGDERGAAEIKFHKVLVDDTGNGFFNYLLKTGQTMNASLKYLKNITPKVGVGCDEEEDNA